MAGNAELIQIGTMLRGSDKTLQALERFIPIGIESVQIFFWNSIPEGQDMAWLEKITARCHEAHIKISSLGLYANPLRDHDSREKAEQDWNSLIQFADQFDIPVVSGFTGRVPGTVLKQSYEPVKAFFSPLVDACLSKGIKLAFENCPMEGNAQEGDWNIAFLPEAWERLLNDYFPTDSVGLEFDPAHCIQLGLPVMKLIEQWSDRVIHIHGKDALSEGFGEFKFPGEGICDWQKILSLLSKIPYNGSIDLEGYHGRFISHESEVLRQKESLKYLKSYL